MMYGRIGPSLPSAGTGPCSFESASYCTYCTYERGYNIFYLRISRRGLGPWRAGMQAECGVIGGCAPCLCLGPISHTFHRPYNGPQKMLISRCYNPSRESVCVPTLSLSLSLRVWLCVFLCLIPLHVCVCACGCVWTYDGQGDGQGRDKGRRTARPGSPVNYLRSLRPSQARSEPIP